MIDIKENMEMIQEMRRVVMVYLKNDSVNEDVLSAAKFVLMYDECEHKYKQAE